MRKVRDIYEASKCEAWKEGDMVREESQTKPLHHHPRSTTDDFWIRKQEKRECEHPLVG